jgi:hypothetical protein
MAAWSSGSRATDVRASPDHVAQIGRVALACADPYPSLGEPRGPVYPHDPVVRLAKVAMLASAMAFVAVLVVSMIKIM